MGTWHTAAVILLDSLKQYDDRLRELETTQINNTSHSATNFPALLSPRLENYPERQPEWYASAVRLATGDD